MGLSNPRFEESYGRLFGSDVGIGSTGDPFFAAFYRRFLASPEIAGMFEATDMDKQIKMLKKSLFQLVTFYVTAEPSAELQRLAEVHANIGIKPEMFDEWLTALLATVREFDAEADEATELAWAWALTPGITYMRLALPAEFSTWAETTN